MTLEPDQFSEEFFAKNELEIYKKRTAIEIETLKNNFSKEAEARRLESEKFITVYKAIIEYAQISIRMIVLANGVGATTIIAFLGSYRKECPAANADSCSIALKYLACASSLLALGVAAGVAATIFAYFSQYKLIINSRDGRITVPVGLRFARVGALVSIIVGAMTFPIGIGIAGFGYTSSW